LPYDVDQDGKLSREEWQAWLDDNQPGRPKNLWDTNFDGKLSAQEIATGRELIRRRLELKFRERFREADVDEDGQLSLEEFSGTMPKEVAAIRIRKAFALLDVDSDGFISVDEFLASGGVGPPRRPPSASLVPKTAPPT